MEKIRRKIFFWTLTLLFLVTAPLVVLHARGYRFDLSRGVFVYSGTVTFKVNPQDVTTDINGQRNEAKQLNRINNSFNLSGLLPGDYDIKISQDGFQSWNKKTGVHSGVSSEFWNVVLVRNNYERTDENVPGVKKFFTSPGNSYIAIADKTDKDLEVKVFDIDNKAVDKSYPFPGWKLIDDAKQENIEWSPKEDYLSVPVEAVSDFDPSKIKKLAVSSENKTVASQNYFIIDPQTDEPLDLAQFLKIEDVHNVRWDPKQKDYLFFLSGTSLFRANTKNASDITTIAENVSNFDLSKTAVYYLQLPNNLVFKSDLDGQGGKNQITSLFPETEDNKIAKMIVYDDLRIAFLTANKDFFIYNNGEFDTYFKRLGGSVLGMHFSDDGKKLLFWTNNEISVYFLREWGVQPLRHEDDLANITRYSEPLANVQWFKDYEHVIFSVGRYVKFLELDPRDHRNSADLLSTRLEKPFIIYNSYLEKLYFTDAKDDSNSLFSIIFPEKLPFLGIGIGGL
jgi:hypothetical protein